MRGDQAFDVLIVGAGPAGMAAACSAAHASRRIAVVDDNPTAGGQIWRGGMQKAAERQSRVWFERFQRANVELLAGTEIVDQPAPETLLAQNARGGCRLHYDKLILATGARERFLPFPGWTLPNVIGAGGLQALIKSGFPIQGKRVVVAGSGPLLLALGALLRQTGADVRLIAEQAPWKRLARFGFSLLGAPAKLIQGAGYRLRLLGVRYATGCWVVGAEGEGKVEAATLCDGRRRWSEPCDYLACGFGFVPSLELPELLGCRMQQGAVWVDQWQQTSRAGVHCAGELTGIGGVDRALVEGQIAGYAAVGDRDRAARLFAARQKARRFAHALDRAFALRNELKELPSPETIVCRCEDVPFERLAEHDGWRAAKTHTRCGMGTCQGRVCGTAAEFLFGWRRENLRPPVFPTKLENLGKADTMSSQQRP